MVSTPSPPAPPDPIATANAQAAANKTTAITQNELNATNQVTPSGSLNYTQSGTWADGTPQLTATQTLSPAEQNIYNLGEQTKTNLGTIGSEQSQKVGDLLNTPFDLNAATGTQQADISKTLLDPVWNQRQSSLETQLANQGITQGSDAYTNAMRDFSSQRDNSYNSALLADRGQATTEALAQRNQPLNEISALLSGSQVSQPSFTNTPSAAVAQTPLSSDVYNRAALANQNYNTQLQNNSAMMGGLFGLGGSLGSMGIYKFSDERLKEDIKEVGETDGGLPVYTYRYKGDETPQMGVMAQDVEKVIPDAVRKFGKFKAVDYSQVA
mgnify:CR=1 FL=1